jgi:hypothetical protein
MPPTLLGLADKVINIERLRDAPAEWNRQFEVLGLNPQSSRLAIAYRPVGDLIPDSRNARTIRSDQIEQLKASIVWVYQSNPG